MFSTSASPNLVITGGAGFIGSNLTLTLQERFPAARLTVIDDFRSGDFKNLAGYRVYFVAQNLATLDWHEQFGDEKFDAIFHLASITDTTLHDQFVQVHDNVGSFRRILNFARPTKTRIIYASSAATYGPATEASVESNGAAPTSGIYNLGTGQARSFNELVDVLNKCLGTNFQPDYIDNPHAHYQNFTQADLTKARSALRYEPRFPLEEGVLDYLQWLYG